MKQALIYSLKVWLTTILGVPVLLLPLQKHRGWSLSHYISEYYWVCIGEMMVFLPVLILVFILALLSKKNQSRRRRKLIILVPIIVLLVVTLSIVHFVQNARFFNWYVILANATLMTSFGLGIWFYKLKPSSLETQGITTD